MKYIVLLALFARWENQGTEVKLPWVTQLPVGEMGFEPRHCGSGTVMPNNTAGVTESNFKVSVATMKKSKEMGQITTLRIYFI